MAGPGRMMKCRSWANEQAAGPLNEGRAQNWVADKLGRCSPPSASSIPKGAPRPRSAHLRTQKRSCGLPLIFRPRMDSWSAWSAHMNRPEPPESRSMAFSRNHLVQLIIGAVFLAILSRPAPPPVPAGEIPSRSASSQAATADLRRTTEITMRTKRSCGDSAAAPEKNRGADSPEKDSRVQCDRAPASTDR